jgi:hypothetical protein
MPTVSQINSGKGLVTFSKEELIDLDLMKWIKADSKGYGKRDFIAVQPIERAAATFFKEKYPSMQVKIAEKCFLRDDTSVDVVLRIATDIADGYYQKHPTKLTFLGEVRAKEQEIQPTYNEEIESRSKKKEGTGLVLPIDFLEENIDKLSEAEIRQIYAELGAENAETFLEDIKLAIYSKHMNPEATIVEQNPPSESSISEEEEENK